MICGTCGSTKPDSEFTSLNRSKDGSRGLCKQCKAQRDAEYQKKKAATLERLEPFDLSPDMLLRGERARIGVMPLRKITDRANADKVHGEQNIGLKAILGELNEPYEIAPAEFINQFDFILVSITSSMDVENLIYTMEKYAPRPVVPKIIVGGFGVINIKLIMPYIDIAVFGRAEGQINQIIAGNILPNVWRKADDPMLEGRYCVRQPRYLVPGEVSVGCRNRCKYCQYTWTRAALQDGQLYNPGHIATQETDWHGLRVDKAGLYISAWDGWSEETRHIVGKGVNDQDIMDKLVGIGNDPRIKGKVNIKVFQIVGYPHETEQSVLKDINNAKAMLEKIDGMIVNDIVLAFLCTPFSPEPLTPMQYDAGNIDTNWSSLLSGMKIYKGKRINAFIVPAVGSPFTLLKRMWINRAETADQALFKRVVFNQRLSRMPEALKVPWLMANNVVDRRMFGKVESAGFDYLYVEKAERCKQCALFEG